jgi:hypothetical protein
MASNPWMTSNDIIEAVKRKIAFPVSQNTFSEEDILRFANEEMFISQVPSVLQYHEEYFVYRVQTPLVSNISRYPIPDRAIGMRLRDLMWSDSSGNFFEMTRIGADDKAFFQRNIGANQAIHKFYLENNDVVLTPSVIGGPTGNLNFFIFLRPNQLVANDRARVIQSFSQDITITNNGAIVAGDVITVTTGTQSVQPIATDIPIVAGVNVAATAAAIVSAVTLAAIDGVSASASGATVTFTFDDITTSFVALNETALSISTQVGFNFGTEVKSLYSVGSKIDFLQTKPGHKTYVFDVRVKAVTDPSVGVYCLKVNRNDLLIELSNGYGFVPQIANILTGDYVCLAGESIIPQIPPDLHNMLAEKTAARILASLGDQAGLAMANDKIKEMEYRQGSLLDDRVEGAPQKITARHSILRYLKMGVRKRM